MRLSTIALSITLAGCGGGGEDMTVQFVHKFTLVETYGDSTRVVPNSLTAPSASLLAEKALQAQGYSVTISNQGVGGTMAIDLLTGDGVHKPWVEQMKESTADIVSINYGVNDANRPAEAYQGAMTELVRVAQAAGKRVMIETPSPVLPPFDAEAVQERAAIARQVAKDTGATLCDVNAFFLDNHYVTGEYFPDNIHPGALGHAVKAVFFAGCLKAML